jgi:uncharacterized protein (DUF488 family)
METDFPNSKLLYTIGHSDRRLEDLVELLHAVGVKILVDVRAYPGSRRHPQFSQGSLRQAMDEAGIQYHWAGRQLGGNRQAQADSPHTALSVDGLRGYADYMDTDNFQIAAVQLINLASRAPTVIMCAERLPAHCHRSLIADHLTLKGLHVVHLIELHDSRTHQLNPKLRRESACLVYDRSTQARLL